MPIANHQDRFCDRNGMSSDREYRKVLWIRIYAKQGHVRLDCVRRLKCDVRAFDRWVNVAVDRDWLRTDVGGRKHPAIAYVGDGEAVAHTDVAPSRVR